MQATAASAPPVVFETGTAAPPPPPRSSIDMREIGDEATWTLSSAKPGNGAMQLRDGNTSTYWQSDGVQPHTILIQFHKRVALLELALYLDHELDESYTPKHIKVCAGSTRHDLETVMEVDLNEPSGWTVLSLRRRDTPLKTYCLRVSFMSMHQNGRDTHVRLIRLFGPRNRQLVASTSVPQPPQPPTMQPKQSVGGGGGSEGGTNGIEADFSSTWSNIAGFTLR